METPNISIEFFPPKTPEGAEKLRVARQKLAELQPKYFSVTFGAGGSTQQGTLDTVLEIQAEGHRRAAPVLRRRHARVDPRDPARIQVARHPPPGGPARRPAERLWRRRRIALCQRPGRIHPRRDRRLVPHRSGGLSGNASAGASPQDDLQNFARKVQAGANAAITQYFYNPDAYFQFVDNVAKLGIDMCRSWPASCRSRTTPS
jgi:methylenetetrahydrofolate reductase (NADPH)